MGISKVGAFLGVLLTCWPFAACSGSDGQRACTLIGCGLGVLLVAPLSDAAADVQSLSIEVCLNDKCVDGQFNDAGSAQGVETASFPDDSGEREKNQSPFVQAFIRRSGEGFELEVEYWPWRQAELRDGDQFSVTARDTAGGTVFSVSQTVTYSESYPNGKECDVVPCRHAAIRLARSAPDGG
jgi:hypothetical protein